MPHDQDAEERAGAAAMTVVQIERKPGELEAGLIPFPDARSEMTLNVLRFFSLEELFKAREVSVGFYFLANKVLAKLLERHRASTYQQRLPLFVHWHGFAASAQDAFKRLHKQASARQKILPFAEDKVDTLLLNRLFAWRQCEAKLQIDPDVFRAMQAQALTAWINYLVFDQKPDARSVRLRAYRAAIGDLPSDLLLDDEQLRHPELWHLNFEFDAAEALQLLHEHRAHLSDAWQQAFLAEYAESPDGATLDQQWQSLIDFVHEHQLAQAALEATREAQCSAAPPNTFDLLPELPPAEQQALLVGLCEQEHEAYRLVRQGRAIDESARRDYGVAHRGNCEILLGLDGRFDGSGFDITACLGDERVNALLDGVTRVLAEMKNARGPVGYGLVDYGYLAKLFVSFDSMRAAIQSFLCGVLKVSLIDGASLVLSALVSAITQANTDEQYAVIIDLLMLCSDEIIRIYCELSREEAGEAGEEDLDHAANAKQFLCWPFKQFFRDSRECWQGLPRQQCDDLKDCIDRLFPDAIDRTELYPFLAGLFSCPGAATQEEIQALANQLFIAFNPFADAQGNDVEYGSVEIAQLIQQLAPQLTPEMWFEALLTKFKVEASDVEFWPKFRSFFACEEAFAHFFMADVLNQVWPLLSEAQQQTIVAEMELDNLAFCFAQRCFRVELMAARLPQRVEEEAGEASASPPADGALSRAGMHAPPTAEGGAPAPPTKPNGV
jgi:hypothetical protein